MTRFRSRSTCQVLRVLSEAEWENLTPTPLTYSFPLEPSARPARPRFPIRATEHAQLRGGLLLGDTVDATPALGQGVDPELHDVTTGIQLSNERTSCCVRLSVTKCRKQHGAVAAVPVDVAIHEHARGLSACGIVRDSRLVRQLRRRLWASVMCSSNLSDSCSDTAQTSVALGFAG